MSCASLLATMADPAMQRRPLARGACLFRQGSAVRRMYVVIEGAVELQRLQQNGDRLVVQRGMPGSILAEASLHTERYHCDAVATLPSVVATVARDAVRARLRQDAAFNDAWILHLANEVRAARNRGELLSLRSVAARLDAWIDSAGGELPAKGAWKSVAGQIGVSPEALYRELARRRPTPVRG